MSRYVLALSLLSLIAGLSVSELHGQNDEKKRPKKPAAITDPAKAGADFAIQGEYSGTVTDDGESFKMGVQVIALGGGKFQAVGYPGGLPGDGWNEEEVVTGSGETKAGQTKITGEDGTAIITDGKSVQLFNAAGDEIGTLKKVVRKSPTLGKKPPQGAVVLFDGTSADGFENGKLDSKGRLMQGVTSKQKLQDCTLHLEFMLSYMPEGRKQGRSNSGCYLQGRYEVQILDSFGLKGEDNECGGIYGVRAPRINMCLPPLTWQTYDIDFTAAKYDDSGKKLSNARMTVRHNGVVVQDDVEVPSATRAAPVKEGPNPGPIYLQDHGNPLRFRNIWAVEKP